MRERTRFERELEALRVDDESFSVNPFRRGRRKDLGFEFDLNYGMEAKAPPTSSAANGIDDDEVLTTHTRDRDSFKVVMDGNRMEISTKAISVADDGKAELATMLANVLKFVSELETGCERATPRTVAKPADSIAGSRVLGQPRFFAPSFAKVAGRPVFPLGLNRKQPYFWDQCKVYAAPQANLDIPLSSVNVLVTAIRNSQGEAPGIALTGSGKYRAGSRSEALFHAQTKVNVSRTAHLQRGTTIGSRAVAVSDLSPNLQGFMILLVQYLRTSEIQYGPRDYEGFPKAYVPLLAKTHFRDLFHQVLNDAERRAFLELYGNAGVRDSLYALAGRSTGGGSRNLFPGKDVLLGADDTHRDRVQRKQDTSFSKRLTWDDLIQNTINNTPLIDRRTGTESLFTPLATATNGPPMAGPEGGRIKGVRVELRRIGFDWVPDTRWKRMTERLFNLTRKLNSIP